MGRLSLFSNFDQIGQGSNGTVYKAVMENSQQVVLKKLSPTMTRSRIDAEIRVGKMLIGVKGVPRFHEDFTEEGSIWLVYDLVEGTDLLEWMESNNFAPASEKNVQDIARQLATILLTCHSSGVAHKDIKLENVMIGKNGKISLIDFGLAFPFESPLEDQLCTDHCGSVEYAAPEISCTVNNTFRASTADVWALGVTLFCLLFGCFPYSYDEKQMKFMELTGIFPPPLWPSSVKVSAQARSFIMSMLDPNPKTRIDLRGILRHSWLNKKSK